MKKFQLSSDQELALLKEEMKILQKAEGLERKKELKLTIEEYHRYLETTRKAAKGTLEPTELVVSTRRR